MPRDYHAPSCEVRPIQRHELPALLELIRELAAFEHMSDEVHVGEAELAALLFAPQPKVWTLLAWQENQAMGYAMLSEHFSSFAGRFGMYLEDIYVRPEQRGGGVGRTLLAHVARLAQTLGHERLDFQVLDWNTKAQGFYESLGARALRHWVPYRLGKAELEALAKGAP
jgi:GNAT superfamily N-acetyltransferase